MNEYKNQHGGPRQNAGRKPLSPDEPTVQISVTLPQSVATFIKQLAKTEGTTVAALVRRLFDKLA